MLTEEARSHQEQQGSSGENHFEHTGVPPPHTHTHQGVLKQLQLHTLGCTESLMPPLHFLTLLGPVALLGTHVRKEDNSSVLRQQTGRSKTNVKGQGGKVSDKQDP